MLYANEHGGRKTQSVAFMLAEVIDRSTLFRRYTTAAMEDKFIHNYLEQ
jgi:hypothetical protein